jgi:hypothetical protein
MICSSVKRLGFMSIPPSEVTDSTQFWRRFRGSGQRASLLPQKADTMHSPGKILHLLCDSKSSTATKSLALWGWYSIKS